MLTNENGPTGDQIQLPTSLFSALCRAQSADAANLVSGLSETTRARLALFCHSRSHLRSVGLAIAHTCSVGALTLEGGAAGQFLHEQAGNTRPKRSRISLGGSHRRIQPTWQSHRPMG